MTENQKLREALQLIAWSNDSKWQADCARQALALPTAAPVGEPVAWMHWLYGPVRLFLNKDEAMMELDRLNREYPLDADDRKMRQLVFGDTATPAPVPAVPQGWVEQMLTDARHVFDAGGPETPQETRDVIEYIASWIAAYRDKFSATKSPAPAVPQGWKLVPVEPSPEMMEAMPSMPAIGAPGDMDLKNKGWSLKAIQNRHRWIAALAATPAPAPAQGVGLTDEEIEAIAKKHMSTVGDHWCNEEAIRERHAEDFARAIIAALRAKGQS